MTRSIRARGYLATGASLAALTLSCGLARAQPSAAAPATSRSPNAIEEIVVTAQRKSEASQTVPIAISAFSQKSLEIKKIEGGPD
ncbi:MAG: hypothetical protein ACR2FH_10420, partial [Caulobacteraceae bacterium]